MTAPRSTYTGLFLVTLATLAYQILLTRIFSVTMWYHFAFLAVSVSMFGLTAGAIAVYLLPDWFRDVHRRLAQGALLFALSIAASFLAHIAVPVSTDGSARAAASLVFTCVVIAVPFTASGVCVALALTRFSSQISTLYAADLLGAALGCLAVVALLDWMDAPTAVFAVALLACLGSLGFASPLGRTPLRRLSGVLCAALALFVVVHSWQVREQSPWVAIRWTKGLQGPERAPAPLHERWNSHSRIRVWGDPEVPRAPFGWSFSPRLPVDVETRELNLDIDASAYTVLTAYDGSTEPLGYLRYDITNLAHYLRRDADVLVIGAGGGRDVLSALVFDQRSVVAVEVNRDILDVVNGLYGGFTGHLDRDPRVRFENDEARSFVARSQDRYDLIQISLIDSWAATGAGAFVLTEHSLYTVEAWKSFLQHLEPGGILSVTRYYFPGRPGAAYRLAGLAVQALRELGVAEPGDHLALALLPRPGGAMFTLLTSSTPFAAADLRTLGDVVDRLGFRLLLGPGHADDEVFERIASGRDLVPFYADFPLDISPPTDDRPFFFHMLRLSDVFSPGATRDQGLASFNMRAVHTLGVLLLTVVALTGLCIIGPLALRSRLERGREATPWFVFFGGIGVGFMLVEISQMERLIVFLGHPVYALSVVLFTLLSASGLGSFATDRVGAPQLAAAVPRRMALLLAVLVGFGLLTPWVTDALRAAQTPVRIAAAVGILAPIGFLMGMAFPLGMKAAAATPGVSNLTPWLWGINGATGVLASVLAIVIALSAGISVSFWTGVGCYAAAALSLVALTRPWRSPGLRRPAGAG